MQTPHEGTTSAIACMSSFFPATKSEPGGIPADASIADGGEKLVHLGGVRVGGIVPQKARRRGWMTGVLGGAMSGREMDGRGTGHHAIIM